MTRSRAKRELSALLLMVVAGAAIRLSLAWTYPNPPQLWWVSDDSYYYFRVALNFHEAGFLTFDGHNPTNGFQPLWQLVLTALAGFFTDKITFVRVVLASSGLIASLAALPIFSYVRMRSAREAAFVAAAAWLFLPGLIAWQLSGMENALYAFALALFVLNWHRRAAKGVGNGALLTFSTVLLFLSRLDSSILILLLFSAAFAAFAIRGNRQGLRTILIAGLTSLAVILPYLAYNAAVFGQMLPVSGVVKAWDGLAALRQSIQTHGAPATLVRNLVQYLLIAKYHAAQAVVEVAQGGLTWAVAALFWGIVGVWFISYAAWVRLCLKDWLTDNAQRRLSVGRATMVDMSLGLFLLVHTGLNITIFSNAVGHSSWYLVPLFVMTLLWVPSLMLNQSYLEWLRNRIARVGSIGRARSGFLVRAFVGSAAAFLIVSAVLFDARLNWSLKDRSHWTSASLELIEWANSNLPSDARIGAWDAGLWGYFREGGVVNLDGVVNSASYLNVLRTGDIGAYLVSEGIDHVIVFDAWNQCRRYQVASCLNGNVLYRTQEFPVSHLYDTHIELIQLH